MESDDEGNDAIAMENIFEGLNGVGAMEGVNGAEAMEGVTGVAAVDVVTEVAAMEGLTRAGANQGGRKRTHCHCNSLKTAQVTLKMETVENANQGSTSVPTAVNVVDPVTLPTDQPPVATENAPTADPTDLPPRPSKKRKANASGPRRTSPAWESFTRVPESESPEPQAACNYCDKRQKTQEELK